MKNLANSSNYTLRQRLFWGMLLLIMPLIIIAISGYGLFRFTFSVLEENLEEVELEMMPVTELQSLILQAQMPANDYLIHGSIEELEKFQLLEKQIQSGFEQLYNAPFDLDVKHDFVKQAEHDWNQASKLSYQIFSLKNPIANKAGSDMMIKMDELMVSSHEKLKNLYILALGEQHEKYTFVKYIDSHITTFLLVILSLVILMILVGAILIQRWIFLPINILRQGAESFGNGQLDHRINLRGKDEIGILATSFNKMADSLEQDREQLHELAIHDPLTNLLNRSEFDRLLNIELGRAKRGSHHFAILMLDIDHFKTINDRYGHPVGDNVILEIARRITLSLRNMDIAARYGGEEFIVLLPETNLDGARTIADRLHSLIRSEPIFSSGDTEICITTSIGVSLYPEHGDSLEKIVQTADSALYEAKKEGRDRIVIAES